VADKIINNIINFIQMKKPDYHILICNSYRVAGDAQGACNKKGASDFLQYISEECADRGLDVAVSSTACLNVCSQGPVMVIHPNNLWFGGVDSEEVIDEILDSLEEGEACEKFLISE
jgi:(2Fe-2S) ferredoxin